jgi:hypothetical protein
MLGSGSCLVLARFCQMVQSTTHHHHLTSFARLCRRLNTTRAASPILPTVKLSSTSPQNLPPPPTSYTSKVKGTETHQKLHIMVTFTRQAMREFHELYLRVIQEVRTWSDAASVGALSDELNSMLRISDAFERSNTPASDLRLSLLIPANIWQEGDWGEAEQTLYEHFQSLYQVSSPQCAMVMVSMLIACT